MSLAAIIAIYFIVWWLTFIAVLPFGVRTLAESGEDEPGLAPSAPSRPHLLRKMLAATLIAAALCGGFFALADWTGWNLDDIPWGNPPPL
jgi:predicted secreted protein